MMPLTFVRPAVARLAVLAFLLPLAGLAAAPAARADASDGNPEIAAMTAPASVTSGMTFSIHVQITTYASGGTAAYTPGDGFSIVRIDGAQSAPVGNLGQYGQDLSPNTTVDTDVTLRADAGTKTDEAPLFMGVDADGFAFLGSPETDIVRPQIGLSATTSGVVFPNTSGTATVTWRNVSASPWTDDLPPYIFSTSGIALDSVPESFGNGLAAGATASRSFPFRIDRSTTGAGMIKAPGLSLPDEDAGVVNFDVQALPKFKIGNADKAMTVGGPTQKYSIELTNQASVVLKTELKVTVVGGATIVSSPVSQGQFDAATGKWTVPGVQPGKTAVITLELRAVNSAPLALTVDGYGGSLVSAAAGTLVTPIGGVVPATPTPVPTATPTATPPPVVVTPPPTVPTPPVIYFDPVAKPTPTPVPRRTDTLGFVMSPPAKNGTRYTFRGSVTYQGAPLSQYQCKFAKLQVIVRSLKRGKPTGKPASQIAALSYSPKGNCAFATYWPFKKKDRGKTFQVELAVKVKIKLPTLAGGQAKPKAVTWSTPITVGKAV